MSGGAMSGGAMSPESGPRLRVDPIACAAVGVCAQVAGAVVDLDRWGYPVVPTRALTPGEVEQSDRAVRACPRRALWLER